MSATVGQLKPETARGASRVALTSLQPRFAGTLFDLLNDWDVVRMLSEVPWPLRHEDVTQFLADAHPAADEFVILCDGEPVGVCAVKKPGSGEPPRTMPRLGYWIGRKYWGRGVGTEAVGMLDDHAFAIHPAAERVGAGIFHDNPASRRVLEKLGFSAVGRKEAASRSRGGMVETIDMQLTRDAWAKRSAGR